MSNWEQRHILEAYSFELGKVDHAHIQERVVGHLNHVDHDLAASVAATLGIAPPEEATPNHGRSSPALSQAQQPRSVATRKVAVLAADGVDAATLRPVLDWLRGQGAICEVLAPHGGELTAADGDQLPVNRALTTMASVLYDAILVAGGAGSIDTLLRDGEAVHYTSEAYKHGKAVAALDAGIRVLEQAPLPPVRLANNGHGVVVDNGVVTVAGSSSNPRSDEFAEAFADAIRAHRSYERDVAAVPA